jgi:RNase P subunit RPR2
MDRTDGCVVNENDENRLQDFLYYITEEGLYSKEQIQRRYVDKIATLDGTCGVKIHEFMKESLNA